MTRALGRWLRRLATPAHDKRQLILRLLAKHGELRGAELVERSDGLLTLGSVFPHLHALERRGHIWRRETRVGAQYGSLYRPRAMPAGWRNLLA